MLFCTKSLDLIENEMSILLNTRRKEFTRNTASTVCFVSRKRWWRVSITCKWEIKWEYCIHVMCKCVIADNVNIPIPVLMLISSLIMPILSLLLISFKISWKLKVSILNITCISYMYGEIRTWNIVEKKYVISSLSRLIQTFTQNDGQFLYRKYGVSIDNLHEFGPEERDTLRRRCHYY